MSDKTSRNYYEYFKEQLFKNRIISIIVLLATILIAVINFYDEVSNFYKQHFPSRVKVAFSLKYDELSSEDKVLLEKDKTVQKIANFNPETSIAEVEVEEGTYNVFIEISGKRIARSSEDLKENKLSEPIPLDMQFTVEGQVRNAVGDELKDVMVEIEERKYTTKDDGRFLLEKLPMKRKYEIIAYFTKPNSPFTQSEPYRGTVPNVKWTSDILYNIDLSKVK